MINHHTWVPSNSCGFRDWINPIRVLRTCPTVPLCSMQSRKYWNFSDTTSYKCHGQYKPLLKLRDRRNASQSQRSPGTGHLLAATSGSHSLPHSCKLFLHPSISQSSSETLKDRRIVSHQLSIILHLHFHLRPMTCPGCTGETQRRKNTTEGTGGGGGGGGEWNVFSRFFYHHTSGYLQRPGT